MVSDTAWAVKDLKTSQDQLHIDFLAFKRFQQLQNDTMIELEGEVVFSLRRDIVPLHNINMAEDSEGCGV